MMIYRRPYFLTNKTNKKTKHTVNYLWFVIVRVNVSFNRARIFAIISDSVISL